MKFGEKILPFILPIFLFLHTQAQTNTPIPLDLQVDYLDGILVFKPSDACLAEKCNTNISSLVDALTHITVLKPDKKSVNTFMPVKVGTTKFYLTIYHYPFKAGTPDTILHLENDSIMIHDVGADGLLTDSTKEYCINKRTQKHLDWHANYAILMEAGVCPIACFMRGLHAQGYKGYLVQLMRDGHTAIMYY